ncbi:MAG TPA: aminopeptidase [Burkholderiaceae bacterium]|nr:aminopeptidase [Burkholderiaceae bacterium]
MARRSWWIAGLVATVLAVALAAGCSTLGYYAQSIHGHVAVLDAARPIPDVIADPAAGEQLKQRLERAQQIRAYATRELALPDNGSYTRYADLKRPYVAWNVFATPELSMELKQWCYPVVGCAGYRGYFDKATADAAAEELRAEGYEVNVAGVPAYSTLGWFADPLLNTFIGGSEGQLAGLLFHELAHQVVFVGGDTTFNESFATAVEREGVKRWLASNGDPASRAAYAEFAERRTQFVDLLLKYRTLLQQNYDSRASDEVKRARKRELFAALQSDYAALKLSWGGYAGYDRFFATALTNAHLAAVGAYNDRVPAFDRLLAEQGGNFKAFYGKVKDLAEMPKTRRDAALDRLQPSR